MNNLLPVLMPMIFVIMHIYVYIAFTLIIRTVHYNSIAHLF